MRISDWSSDVCSADLGKIPKILALCETGQLRLAPALIWKSGERPALFAGTVAIDTTPAETNGSAPGTPPAVVGQPAPEGQETPPWECPRSDTALPTAARSEHRSVGKEWASKWK